MQVFINFWKLVTENNILHVFSFFHKLSFENSFCFLSILDCQTSFLVSKIDFIYIYIRKKIENKEKKQLANIPLAFSSGERVYNWVFVFDDKNIILKGKW